MSHYLIEWAATQRASVAPQQRKAAPLRALITGITGFAGGALGAALQAKGWTVFGAHGGRRNLPAALAGLTSFVLDLEDGSAVDAMLRRAQPDVLFHLGGRTGASFATLLQSHAATTATLLDAVRRYNPTLRVIIPGSSAQFGQAGDQETRIGEDTPYRPATLYGIAKVAEAWAAEHFHHAFGLAVIRTHTFNCFGPGQRAEFVPATFASQIAAIERGTAPPVLMVGNLNTCRDMTDIRDVASAYLHLALHGHPGEVYNICSGTTVPMRAIVEGLRDLAHVAFEIRQDPARLRAGDVASQTGDPARIRAHTGWCPNILLGQTISDVLEEWRGNHRP